MTIDSYDQPDDLGEVWQVEEQVLLDELRQAKGVDAMIDSEWDDILHDENCYGGFGEWDEHDQGDWFSSDANYHDEFRKRKRMTREERQDSLRQSLPWITVCSWDYESYSHVLYCAKCGEFVTTTPSRARSVRIGCECHSTNGIPSRWVCDAPTWLDDDIFSDIADAYSALNEVREDKATRRKERRKLNREAREARPDPPIVDARAWTVTFDFIEGVYTDRQARR